MERTVIANAEMLDLRLGQRRPGVSVLVEEQRIVEVSEKEIVADGARRIDGRGKTLMPGLIDAHVHPVITKMNLAAMPHRPTTLVSQEARVILEGMLRRGFTTVRDAGGGDRGLAQAVELGLIEGPRILYAGRVLSQTGGHGDFRPPTDPPDLCGCSIHTSWFSHVADGVDAVRRAAREELRRGASQIKIMASGGVASPSDPIWNVQYSPEEMRAAVEEAQGWRTYVMAHAYTPEAITRAVEAGVRSIEHGNLIDRPTAELMARKDAILVPTLVTYRAIDEIGRQLGFPEVSLRKLQDVLTAGLSSLEIARDAGVKMGFGTDLLGEAHDQQSRELEIRAEVLPPLEVLRHATINNAELLNRKGEIGEIVPGAYADLLLVDGDPLTDISCLAGQGEHIAVIMKAGRVIVS